MKRILSLVMIFMLLSTTLVFATTPSKQDFKAYTEVLGYQMLEQNGYQRYINVEKLKLTNYSRELYTLNMEVWDSVKICSTANLSKDRKSVTMRWCDIDSRIADYWTYTKDKNGNLILTVKLVDSGKSLVYKVTKFNSYKEMLGYAQNSKDWQDNYEADLAYKEKQENKKILAEKLANDPVSIDNPMEGEYFGELGFAKFFINDTFRCMEFHAHKGNNFAFRMDNPVVKYMDNGVVTYTGDLLKLESNETVKNATVVFTTANRKTIQTIEVLTDSMYYSALSEATNFVADSNSILNYFKLEN